MDVGCYRGELLKELSTKYKNGKYHGYDIKMDNKKLFLKKNKFKFWNNLNLIKEKFDLITCVNTLQYHPVTKLLIHKMRKLLKEDGKLFLVVVNASLANPYGLTYGDQYTWYTKKNLYNLLIKINLEGKILSHYKSFPRNIIAIIKKNKNKNYKFLKEAKVSLQINYLKKVEKRIISLQKITKKITKNFYILGNTANSTFIFEIFKKQKIKVKNFVDENPGKINSLFKGKKIIHPSKILKNSILILPYGKTNNTIYKKLKRKYKFKFFKV